MSYLCIFECCSPENWWSCQHRGRHRGLEQGSCRSCPCVVFLRHRSRNKSSTIPRSPNYRQLKKVGNTRNKTVHFQLNLWTFRWFVSLSSTHSDMVECCSLVRSPDFRGRQLRHIEEPGLCRFSSCPVDLRHTSLYTCPSSPSLPTLHRLNIKNRVTVLKY